MPLILPEILRGCGGQSPVGPARRAGPAPRAQSPPPSVRSETVYRPAFRRRRSFAAMFTLAIVGRPNVGKSTLFNRLVGKRLALVDDQPGVTRDLREGEARLGDLRFTVIDTAGLEEATDDSLPGPDAQADRAGGRDGRCLPVPDRRARRRPARRPDLRRHPAAADRARHPRRQQGRGARRGGRAARGLLARPRRADGAVGRAWRGARRSCSRAACRWSTAADAPRGRRSAPETDVDGRRRATKTRRDVRPASGRCRSRSSAGRMRANRR